MVVARGHCRGKSKGKTKREKPESGCQGTNVWLKVQNRVVRTSGKTIVLLEGRVRGYPIAKMPLDTNLFCAGSRAEHLKTYEIGLSKI